eukprot:922584-Pyramimonas_sp.AAC.1
MGGQVRGQTRGAAAAKLKSSRTPVHCLFPLLAYPETMPTTAVWREGLCSEAGMPAILRCSLGALFGFRQAMSSWMRLIRA